MNRIKGFDGLRAIAVIAVFFGHMRPVSIPAGAMAVYMFFVLSGFLITGILSEQRKSIENGSNAFSEISNFYYRRSLRIFPIYFATLAAFSMWIWVQTDSPPAGLWSYILYVANFWQIDNGTCDVLLCHFWSLSIEEQFYVFVAPLLTYIAFSQHVRILATIFFVCIGLIFMAPFFKGTDIEKYLLSVGNFSMLSAGGIMSIFYRRKYVTNVSSLTGLTALSVLVIFLFFNQVFRSVSPHLYSVLFSLMVVCIATVLCWIVLHQNSTVVRLLEWRPLAYLGTISYGFYLLHPGVIHTWRGLIQWPEIFTQNLSKNSLAAISATIFFSATVLLSHLSWKYFEKPILKHRHKFTPATSRTEEIPIGENLKKIV